MFYRILLMNTLFSSTSQHGLYLIKGCSQQPHGSSLLRGSSQSLPKNSRRPLQPGMLEDISNGRVREMIANHCNLKGLVEGRGAEIAQREEVRSNAAFLQQFEERKWLVKKGKKYLIDFDNQERKEMKQYFNSLDSKKSGSIGIDELQELLLSVGLFQTREEIKVLIDSVDEDKSGKIEFGEFLSMIQNDQGQNEEIVSFFKSVIGGSLKHDARPLSRLPKPCLAPKSYISQILENYPYPKGLSFEMVVSHIRRKHMMTALNIGRRARRIDCSSDSLPDHTLDQIAKGQRVMQALQKMYERKVIRQIKESKRSSQARPPSHFQTHRKPSLATHLPEPAFT